MRRPAGKLPVRALAAVPRRPDGGGPVLTESVVHPTAVVEDGALIEDGVRIWHFVHVRSGATIGADTQLGKSVYVDKDARIGARCRVQNFVSVYAGVTLEDDVFVGPSAVFTNDPLPRAHNDDWAMVPTTVRRGASIGANATIVCGVEIGAWAMVAAGAVVTRDVESHQLVGGTPARPMGWVCRCGRRIDEQPGDDVCRHRSAGEHDG